MATSSALLSHRFGALNVLLGRLRLRPVGADLRNRRRRFQPWLERLEDRCVPTVSILNGGGNGYVGNGGGGPPDVTGMAGPSSYIEVTNSTVTIFSPKDPRTILAQDGINDFFFNPAIGNQTLIDQPFSGQLLPIAASPTGATEAGNTVTITTTSPLPGSFSNGTTVQVAGVGVAGYNGVFTITAVTPTTFTYTDPTSGLANSGGGTASVDPGSCGTCDSTGVFDNLMGTNGRFIIGDIDVDGTTNVSQYVFAVSKSSNPTALDAANWNFYHVTTTQTSGGATSWTDYPGNPGFNADAFVETFNLAKGGSLTGQAEIVSINASDLANGVSQASLHTYQNFSGAGGLPGGTNSYRATAMQDSVAGDPMWLLRNPGDGANLQVIKMTNVLSNSASFAITTLSLPAADNFDKSGINSPLNPDSTPMSDIDTRILNASEYNNTVVAAHKVPIGNASAVSATVQVSNGVPVGGSGYTVGDILTLTGGTGTSATLKVATVGAGGSVSTVTVATAGSYSSLAGINGAVSGGTGSGAKFNVVFSGELDVQWYAIDVSSGTPAFQLVGGSPNVGRIGFGANTYSVDPAIAINSSGQIGLGFMESDTTGGAINAATGGFISTFVTARKPTDAAGTMEPVVLVPAGTGSGDIGGRIGDFSGTNVDPVNGTFWHVNEFGGGGPTDIANFTPNAPPVVTPPADQTSVEGASATFNLGSFTDPDGGPWTVDVNWGDGTPDTVFTATAPGTIAAHSHTFGEEGTYTVTIKVTDTFEGQFDSKTYKVTVSDPAVVAKGVAVNAVEGAAFTGKSVATFTDPGGAEPNPSDPSGTIIDHYKVDSISWGDGTPLDTTSGAISLLGSTFTVSGNHTYGEEGTYTITAIVDHEGVLTKVATTATVSDPAVVATGVPVFGVECRTLTVPTATFTDPGGAEPNPSDPTGGIPSHYTASINWGDLTPATAGTITYVGSVGSKTGVFTVTGSHAYAHEGTYTVTTTIDHEGIITKTTSTAVIKDDIGLLLLDPTGSQSLFVTGNGSVTATGCGAVVVDSSNSRAAFLTGHGTVTAEDIDVTGGVKTAGHGSFSTSVDHETATPDPLGLGLPSAPATHFGAVHISTGVVTLSPGTYDGGIEVSGQASVTLLPGVYYMNGGGFEVSGQGSVTDNGAGVLIINAPTGPDDAIRITGQGSVTLTAPSSLPAPYAAYKGITLFQDPASSNPIQFTGQASVTLTGVAYAPDAQVEIDGNANVTINAGAGTATLPPVLGALIAYDLKVDGNGVLTINPDDPPSGSSSSVVFAVSSNGGLVARSNGGTGAAPSAALGTAGRDSAAGATGLAILLNGNQQVLGNNPSLAPAAPSAASASASHQAIVDELFSNDWGGGASTTLSASLNEQLRDVLFSHSAGVS